MCAFDMKKISSKALALVLTLALAVGLSPSAAFAQGDQGASGATDANVLTTQAAGDELTALAASTDTLYVSGTTNFHDSYGLINYLDPERYQAGAGHFYACGDLFKAAAQRAAEISIYYSQSTRPDGSNWNTVLPSGKFSNAQEFIYVTEDTSFLAPKNYWLSRADIKSVLFDRSKECVGAASFSQGSEIYWVIIVASGSDDNRPTTEKISATYGVKVNYGVCANQQVVGNYPKPLPTSMKAGATCTMKYGVVNSGLAGTQYAGYYTDLNPKSAKWTSSNKKVATVSATGKITAVGKGTATIKATLPSGRSLSHKVTVTSGSSSTSTAKKLTIGAIASKPYTGKAIKPAVTVKAGSVKLKKGTHYTVTYKNNKNVGYATVVVKGKGKYKNLKATKSFEIVPKKLTGLKVVRIDSLDVYASWNKTTTPGATGYQFRISFNADMSNATQYETHDVKACNIKAHVTRPMARYYMQVRAFTEIGGKYFLGPWSNKVTADL